jgi:hypothetical protein
VVPYIYASDASIRTEGMPADAALNEKRWAGTEYKVQYVVQKNKWPVTTL